MGGYALSGEKIEHDWKPKIRSDIYYNDIYSNGETGYWVVGSLENDSQLLVNSNKKDAFYKLMMAMTGENTVDDLCKKGYGDQEELEKIIRLCYNKGLLTDSKNVERFNEAERLSIKLFKYKFKDFSAISHKICRGIVFIFPFLLVCMLMLSVYSVINNMPALKELTIRTMVSFKGDTWINVVAGYLLIQILCLFMGILHEIAHAVVSLKNDCQPRYLAFVLYLGFMPMAYVKQKSIYSIEKKKILQILFAGVVMNFFLFLLFGNLYLYTGNDISKLLAVTNFRLAVTNLVPFALTDGYYIFSILFKKPNLRMNFFRLLAYPNEIRKFDRGMCACFIVYFFTIVICFNMEMVVLLNVIFSHFYGVDYLLLIPINIMYLFLINRVNRKKFVDKKHNLI